VYWQAEIFCGAAFVAKRPAMHRLGCSPAALDNRQDMHGMKIPVAVKRLQACRRLDDL
jgi:hypothetical protein